MDSYSVQAILTLKDNLSAGLKNAAGATESLGGKFKRAVGLGAAMQIGMGAVSKAVSTMTSHIDSAVSRYDQLNNFPRVMNNLGISSKAASSALKSLDKGITGLPTTLDAATQGVTRFVSKNGDIKKSTDYFLAMNNAMLAGGASVESQGYAVEQLSQAYAKGKMDMVEWRSIQTAMPAQLNQVAKAMGMTADQLGEGLRSGTISMDEFMDTMVKLNKEGVDGFASFEKQALTATGGIKTAFTNMNTAITRGIANSIGAIDEMLVKNNLPTIAEMINKAGSAITKTFTKISAAIKRVNINGVIAGITPAFTVLKTAVEGAASVIGSFVGFLNKHAEALLKIASAAAMGVAAFKGFSVINKAIKGYKSFITVVNQSRAAMLNYKAATEGASLAAAVANGDLTKQQAAYGYLGNKINGAVSKIAAFVKSNLTAAASAISNATAQAISAIANSRVGTAARAAATKVLAFAAAHKAATIAALGVAGPIIALAAYMMTTGANADEVADKITAFADRASEAIAAFANKMPQIMNAVVKAITDNINSIVMALTEVINSVVGALPELLPLVIEAGIQLFMGLVQAITQVIEPLVNTLPQIIDAIVSAIPVLIPAIIEAGITLFSALIDAIPKVLPVIVAAVPQIVKAIVKGIIQLAGEMLQAGVQLMRSFLNGLKSLFGTIISSVVSFAKLLPGKIRSGLGSLVSIGKDFIAGLWNGIKAKFDSVINKVKSLASKLPGVVKKVLGIASPSKVMAKVGIFFDAGLEKGILKGTKSVRSAATKLAGAAVKSVDISGIESRLNDIKMRTIKQPDFAMAYSGYSGSASDDYYYGGGGTYVIEVPVNIDGREVSRVAAPYMQSDLNRLETRESRKRGKR